MNVMDAHKQSINLRALWDSRTRRGLLPVLDEMNDLLSRGLITDEEYAAKKETLPTEETRA